jgi:hypothetical protein
MLVPSAVCGCGNIGLWLSQYCCGTVLHVQPLHDAASHQACLHTCIPKCLAGSCVSVAVVSSSSASLRCCAFRVQWAECAAVKNAQNFDTTGSTENIVETFSGVFERCGELSNIGVWPQHSCNCITSPGMLFGCRKLHLLQLSAATATRSN